MMSRPAALLTGWQIPRLFCLLALWLLPAMARGQHLLVAESDADFTHRRMVELWHQRTEGENLARDRAVTFYPTPSYHLTVQGESDTRDLTDGVLATGEHSDAPQRQDREHNQMIWFSPQAVGWAQIASPVNRITIDLGETRAVDRVVWRVVAGSAKRGFQGPASVRLYGSSDGESVRLLQERHRYREDIARPGAYELPNLGPADVGDRVYVYPLELNAGGYPLRFVVIEFEMDTHWMASDELAVIAAVDSPRTEADFQQLPTQVLQVRDVWIAAPRHELPVVRDLRLPVWFRQSDLRGVSDQSGGVTYHFTLPAGLQLEAPARYPVQRSEDGRQVVFSAARGGNSRGIGPFFFTADQGLPQPGAVTFQARGEKAEPQPPQTLMIHEATLPPPFELEHLTVSIGWMADHLRREWIDFLPSYQRLGFNTVPSMPRAWWDHRKPPAGVDAQTIESATEPDQLTLSGRDLAAMRQAGLKVVYMESPFHVINWRYPEHASEYRHQVATGISSADSFCATYRGPFYQEEVQRIRESFLLMGGADYVMWDCEFIGSALHTGPRCARCAPALQASGMDLLPFMRQQWGGIFAELNTALHAIAEQRGWVTPQIGMYGVHAMFPYANLMTYPDAQVGFDFQNPSLYVGPFDEVVHRQVRHARTSTGRNDIIPWMSTRTGGQVPPHLVKIMVWEALLNGSRGLTYYHLGDFDPGQLLAVCEALAAVAPHERLLLDGQPAHDQFQVLAGEARLSAVERDGQRLLLLVNPTEAPQRLRWQGPDGLGGEIELPPRHGELIALPR